MTATRPMRPTKPRRMYATVAIRLSASGEVHRETFEIGQRAVAQRAFLRSAQDHARRPAGFESFLPTGRTQAPTVAGLEAAKAEFRHRGRKIVAARFGKLEKRRGHDRADRVAADVLSPGIAAAVAEEPGHGIERTHFEPVTEHVTGCVRPTASMTPVVPQHGCLRAR